MTSSTAGRRRRRGRRAGWWPLPRRSILKLGALAFGSLGFGAATASAAAQRGGKGELPERVPVIDSDDSEPDPAIVINSLDVPISDWIVFGSETVADHNPAYDPDDRVVIVAFEHLLDSGWPDWRRAEPDALFDGVVDRGIKFHAFPKARLDRGRSNRGRDGN